MKPTLGYSIMRVSVGTMIFLHGLFKFFGGEEEMLKLGNDFSSLIGVSLFPLVMGYFAAGIQAVGGLVIAVGSYFRYVIPVVLSTLVVAIVVLLRSGEPFSHYSHPIELSLVLTSMMIIGPRLKS